MLCNFRFICAKTQLICSRFINQVYIRCLRKYYHKKAQGGFEMKRDAVSFFKISVITALTAVTLAFTAKNIYYNDLELTLSRVG